MNSKFPNRILFLSGSSSLQSGAELRMLEKALYFEKKGRKITVAIPVSNFQEELSSLLEKSKVEVCFFPLTRPHRPLSLRGLTSYTFRAFWSVIKLICFIRKGGIEIVHVNEFFDIPGLIAGKLAGAKTVCHIQVIIEKPLWLKFFLLSLVIRFSDKIICSSQAVKEKMFNGITFNSEKIEKIYDPGPNKEIFDPRRYLKETTKEKLGIPKNYLTVGLVSKFTKNKGQINLVKAAKLIKEQSVNDVSYLFIGGRVTGHEDYFNEVLRLAEKEGLKEKMIFTGYRNDIPELINVCDIIVHIPIHNDPLPGVVLEAMAMEKPVIGSKSGGIPEEFENGVSGILIPRNDPQSLAKAILNLYQDEEVRWRMGSQARKYLNEHFSWNKHFSQLQDVYIGILHSK